MEGEVDLPSYTYPGLYVLEGVLRVADGMTADHIANKLKVRLWRIKSAIGGLRKMGLITTVRDGRRVLYFSRSESIHKAFVGAFYRYLLPLSQGRSLEWMMTNFWPRGKRTTSYKRATYLLRLGRDLGLIVSKDGTHLLTIEGLRTVLARAVEVIYVMETEGKMGDYVSLTRVLSKLSEWGIEPKLAKELLRDAISELNGRLSPSPALSKAVLRDGIRVGGQGYLYYLSLKGTRWE